MTKTHRHLLLAGLCVAGIAAASVAVAQTAPAAPVPAAPAPAAAPSAEPEITAADAQAGKLGKPPAGKSLIVFYRPGGMGAALGFTIREGETQIAKVGNGSYQVYIAEPGTHEYKIQSEATDTIRMEIDAGETYYVKQTMSMGLIVGRPHLSLSDQASFEKLHASLRVSKWTAPAAKAEAEKK